MANLDSLIKVNVSLGAPAVQVEGFGTILIATDDNSFAANAVKVYTSAAAVDADADLGAQAKVEAKAVFALSPAPDRVKVGNYNPANPIGTELSAIDAGDSDWYGLIFTGSLGFTQAQIEAAALWAKPRRKLYFAQSSDAAILSATAGNVLENLQAQTYENTLLIYHATDTEPCAVEALAGLLAVNPDVQTTIAAWKILPGITKQTQLTDTQLTNILGPNNYGNVYSEVKGLGSFQKGKTVAGRFVDTILSKHWMEARMEEAIAQVLSDFSNRGSKVPYTDPGLALMDNTARRVLRQGVQANHIVRSSEVVTVPRLAEVPLVDRQARIFRLNFSATLSGAGQEADWTGSLEIGT